MKIELPFGQVKPGEGFEFEMQVLGGCAIKAAEVRVAAIDGSYERKANFVMTKVTRISADPILVRKPGDFEWLPDDAPVVVHRSLASGS